MTPSRTRRVSAIALAVLAAALLGALTPPFRRSAIMADDVTAFGAKGDGVTDDTAAINNALFGGNRTVVFPCGTYLHDTLLVDDHTEIAGAGPCTILKRRNVTTSVPNFINCAPTTNWNSRDTFYNRNNGCGNTRIHVHDLVIDGSLLVTPPGADPQSLLAFHFDAVTQTKIERITVLNWPQDAIHFRNGWGNVVDSILVDGHNLIWGNGGGVNYETHTDSNEASSDPLIVTNSTFITDGPAFCSDNLATVCDDDADCPGDCIGGGVVSIAVSAIDNGAVAPGLTATNNTIRLSNYHLGIQANYARGVRIAHNGLRAVATRAGGLTGVEKRIRGIQCFFATSGTRPTNRDCIISGNTIAGDATVASLASLSPTNRVQGCIMVVGDEATTNGVVVTGNACRDFDLTTNEAGIWVRGTVGSTTADNTVTGIVNGSAAVRVGSSTEPEANAVVRGNVITALGAGTEAFQAQEVTASTIADIRTAGVTTRYQLLGTNAITFDDQIGQTNAQLTTLAAHAANGSRVFCSDCTIASPCAAAGTGALAKRLNGAWVCN